MTEKCFEERFRDVEENYKAITNRIAEAAVRSGRKPEDITFLAATKTVPAEVINHAIGCGSIGTRAFPARSSGACRRTR